jgi:hypothetical protein
MGWGRPLYNRRLYIICVVWIFSHWWDDDGRCLGWDTRECTVRRTDIISRFKYSSKIHEANTKGT